VNFPPFAILATTPDPAPPKSDVEDKGGAKDGKDGLPSWVTVQTGALAAAALFLLLGVVMLGLALRGTGRILFQIPLTFGGRGYGWEASRPLGLLASSAACFVLAVLLLLQLVNGSRGKADKPPEREGAAASAAKTKASGS
jgi:hypothetical protein